MTDVKIENCGTLFMFEPVTAEAKEWVDENLGLESWQWFGKRFAVEHRYAGDLIDGMAGDGLELGDA